MCVTEDFEILQHLNLNIFQCIDFFLSRNLKNDPPTFDFHQFFSFHLVCYKENKWHFSSFLWINLWKNNNSFNTSHTSKKILKFKYSVNYKTSMLLLLIIVAKKKPWTLLENDVHVHSFMELPFNFRYIFICGGLETVLLCLAATQCFYLHHQYYQ